jgi:hypothetical protein
MTEDTNVRSLDLSFLTPLERAGVSVINIHPALPGKVSRTSYNIGWN